ncbi:Arylsulfatase [Rhodococcus ruber]
MTERRRSALDSSRARGITRRNFGKLAGMVGAGGLGATATACGPDQNAAAALPASSGEREFRARSAENLPQPNILAIIADDLGWADLGCYGAPEIRTPNLDRLAASGVRYTDGYSASSTCSPTRFAFYTGRFPGRLAGGLMEPIGNPDEIAGIPSSHPTLGSLLRGAGYRTAMIGKWHCGFLPWFSPTRSGWETFFGNFSGGLDYFSKITYTQEYDLYENEVEYQDLRYYTDIITERAIEYVTREDDGPWLLNLNYTAPHWPWEGPNDHELSKDITARVLSAESPLAAGAPLYHADGGSLEKYREMVEHLDTSVGAVLNALDSSGASANTLVLFFSDNGGERYSYQWPLTGGKSDLHEGGIRVPTILAWPGRIDGGQVDHLPVTTLDWAATLVALAGATPDAGYPFDGADLTGYLFRGEPVPDRELFWRVNSSGALRDGDLKLLRANGQDQLFDVRADPRELVDLAQARPTELADLVARWERVDATLLPYPERT